MSSLKLFYFAVLVATTTSEVREARLVVAAGCFWSVELAYQRVPGVLRTSVGYAGGDTPAPTYHEVSRGRTGHTEAVEVVYNPSEVSARQLIDLFWLLHDPTTLNRQGMDVGTQYRSAIYYFSEDQLEAISVSKAALAPELSARVVTEIKNAAELTFGYTIAEDYHQQYLEKLGQDSRKGSLSPIQCYGERGPIKQMDKPGIKAILLRSDLRSEL